MRYYINTCTLGLLFLISSCGSSSKSEKKTGASLGIKAYKNQCATCHGGNGNLMMGGAKDLTKSTLSDSEIETIIRNGKGSMPEFASKLSEEEIKETVKFVVTLRN